LKFGFGCSDFGEIVRPDGVAFAIGLRVLEIGKLAFDDKGRAFPQITDERESQFVRGFDGDRYGLSFLAALCRAKTVAKVGTPSSSLIVRESSAARRLSLIWFMVWVC
jgi:hypothetical protein